MMKYVHTIELTFTVSKLLASAIDQEDACIKQVKSLTFALNVSALKLDSI